MKARISLAAVVFFLFSVFATAAFAASDNILSGNIKEADSTTGQDTNTGSGVKTGHLQDYSVTTSKVADSAVTTQKISDLAVTDAKIAGPISASKISSTGLNADTVDGMHAFDLAPAVHTHSQSQVNGLEAALAGKADVTHNHSAADILSGTLGVDRMAVYSGTKIVHKGPSDGVNTFNTITGALNAIADASDTNRYAVVVMPGIYEESILGKSYVDIVGQSRTGSIIRNSSSEVAVSVASNMFLKNLTVDAVNGWYGIQLFNNNSGVYDSNINVYVAYGLVINSANTTVENVTIKTEGNAVGLGVGETGVSNASTIVLKGINIYCSSSYGLRIYIADDSTLTLRDIFTTSPIDLIDGNVDIHNMISDASSFLWTPNWWMTNTVRVGNSKIKGGISPVQGVVFKVVHSYDGNYDPIPDGIY